MSEEVGYDLEAAKLALDFTHQWVENAKFIANGKLDNYTGYLCFPEQKFIVCAAVNEGRVAGVVPVLYEAADDFISIFTNALEQADDIRAFGDSHTEDEDGDA